MYVDVTRRPVYRCTILNAFATTNTPRRSWSGWLLASQLGSKTPSTRAVAHSLAAGGLPVS